MYSRAGDSETERTEVLGRLVGAPVHLLVEIGGGKRARNKRFLAENIAVSFKLANVG